MRPTRLRGSLRIVSWNIERGLQLPKILDFLRTIDADLLLLQEVDLNARWTRCRDIANDLARALNLNYAFGMEFQELSEGTTANPCVSVVASALQVKVIAHHLAGVDRCFGYESDPPAEPALKDRNIRHKPPRFPEVGLVSETNDPGSQERPSSGRCRTAAHTKSGNERPQFPGEAVRDQAYNHL